MRGDKKVILSGRRCYVGAPSPFRETAKASRRGCASGLASQCEMNFLVVILRCRAAVAARPRRMRDWALLSFFEARALPSHVRMTARRSATHVSGRSVAHVCGALFPRHALGQFDDLQASLHVGNGLNAASKRCASSSDVTRTSLSIVRPCGFKRLLVRPLLSRRTLPSGSCANVTVLLGCWCG